MTHEEFKEACLREFPKIEKMVEAVKSAGLYRVRLTVCADGYICLDYDEPDGSFHDATRIDETENGLFRIVDFTNGKEPEWSPLYNYHADPVD